MPLRILRCAHPDRAQGGCRRRNLSPEGRGQAGLGEGDGCHPKNRGGAESGTGRQRVHVSLHGGRDWFNVGAAAVDSRKRKSFENLADPAARRSHPQDNVGSQCLGIRDRGILQEGLFADIAAFNADLVVDHSPFENPNQLSTDSQRIPAQLQVSRRSRRQACF
jgi:hypothetical protein